MRRAFLNIISVFMLLMLGLQTNYLLACYGLFKLNQESLISEKCEKVVANCNACCYLNKKMSDPEGTAQASADPVNKNVQRTNIKLSEYVVSFINYSSSSGVNDFLQYFRFNESLYHSGYLQNIDHPPQV